MDTLLEVTTLSDKELIENLKLIVLKDRRCTVRMLKHLAEVDHRDIIKEMGYRSMFDYCTRGLRFAEAIAYWRIHTARTARKFPELFDLVEDGALNISSVTLLNPVLTEANREEVIKAACGKTRKELEAYIAGLNPTDPRADRIVTRGSIVTAKASSTVPDPPQGQQGPLLPDVVEALDAVRRRLHFDVGPETAELLERAREILRHKYPFATMEDIIKEALNILLDHKDLERGLDKAGPERDLKEGSRTIPLRVRREVWKRDNGRCAYVAEDGTACATRSWLEFDHIVPFAKGGRGDDPANVRLLCRSHNQAAARAAFS